MEVFEAVLGGALGSLSWWVATSSWQGGWNWMVLCVLMNPEGILYHKHAHYLLNIYMNCPEKPPASEHGGTCTR